MPAPKYLAPQYLIAYVVILIVFAGADAIWLGVVATPLYQQGIGHLMATTPNLVATAAFYVLFPAGLVFFAVAPAMDNGRRVAGRAACLGLIAYGTYDLTNLATLRDWPGALSLIDVVWGAFVSTLSSCLGWLAIRRIRHA